METAFLTRIPPAHCGIAEYSSMLISGLLARGLRDMVVLGDRGWKDRLPPIYPEPYSGVTVYKCFDAERPGFSSAVDCLRRLGGVDILHVQHEYAIFPDNREFLDLIRAVRRYAERIIVTLHTVAHYSRGNGYVAFQRELANLVDAMIVHSSLQEFELFVQGIKLDGVYRIPHGTLINPYMGTGKGKLLGELGFNWANDKFVMVVPGFLRKDKGLDPMLEAYRLLGGLHNGYMLILQGERQGVESYGYAGSLLDTVKPEGVIFSERYLKREELLMLLAAADVIAFPYIDSSYGVSGALHLAMGSNRPLVCTRVPKLVECYENAPGLAIPAGVPGWIAAKIVDVRDHMGYEHSEELEAIRRYAEATSWDLVAKRHLEIYREVLGKGPKPVVSRELKL